MNLNELKFYLYRSRAKVDWLYQQIESSHGKRTKLTWKIDLKVLSIGRESDRNNEATDEEKLKAVLSELEAQQLIGCFEDRKPYIKGIFPMRWGLYNDHGFRPESEGPLVYFSGLQDGLLLGLGGSSHHIVGNYGLTSTGSRSVTPALVQFLRSGLDGESQRLCFYENRQDEISEVSEAMALANDYLKGPIQNLEFVAKVLCRGEQRRLRPFSNSERGEVILATPLYVAQIDPMFVDG